MNKLHSHLILVFLSGFVLIIYYLAPNCIELYDSHMEVVDICKYFRDSTFTRVLKDFKLYRFVSLFLCGCLTEVLSVEL